MAHASEEETAPALKLVGETGAIDARGVPITRALLERILAAAPRGEDEEPLITDCQFGGATFSGAAGFGGATFGGHAEFTDATFSGDAMFGGATFSGDAMFGGATFSGNAWFGGATFSGDAEFREATFTGNAEFREATFTRAAGFRGATFTGDAGFRGATFSGNAEFGGAIFDDADAYHEAIFSGDALLGGAIFDGAAEFGGAIFDGAAEFREATFTGHAGFTDATFSGYAMFYRATFDDDAEFREATFTACADFGEATFDGAAEFGGATFDDEADFGKATFNSDARFHGVTFNGDAGFRETPFNGLAWFGGATFTGDAEFGGATFTGEAWFEGGATFTGPAVFDGATFSDKAVFDGATFSDEAKFREATFKRRASFAGVRFEQAREFGPLLAYFGLVLDDVQFAQPVQIEVSSTELSCSRARFTGGAQFRLRGATVLLDDTDLAAPSILTGLLHPSSESLAEQEERIAGDWPLPRPLSEQPQLLSLQRANVAGLGLTNVSATDCRFAGAHNLDKLRLESDVSFASAPLPWNSGGRRWEVIAEERAWRVERAAGSRLPRRARALRRWGDLQWPDWLDSQRPGVLEPAQIAGLYRALRKGREDAKDEPGAADFYYGEMEMRRHARRTSESSGDSPVSVVSRGRVERAILTVYWLVSGYGLRAWRAIACLAAVTLLFAVAFHLVGFVVPPRPVSYWTSLLYAFRATLSLTDSQVTLTAWGQLLQAILRLTGPVLFGLALLALRGRVKR